MNFSPLLHGSSGWFDEIILVAEAALVIGLAVMFFRSRGRKPMPPSEPPVEARNPPTGDKPH